MNKDATDPHGRPTKIVCSDRSPALVVSVRKNLEKKQKTFHFIFIFYYMLIYGMHYVRLQLLLMIPIERHTDRQA